MSVDCSKRWTNNSCHQSLTDTRMKPIRPLGFSWVQAFEEFETTISSVNGSDLSREGPAQIVKYLWFLHLKFQVFNSLHTG